MRRETPPSSEPTPENDKRRERRIGSRKVGVIQGLGWAVSLELVTARPVISLLAGIVAGIGEYRKAKRTGY